MCGIHGLFTGKARNNDSIKFLSDGFIVNQVRGTDGTGIATIDTDLRRVDTAKIPVMASLAIQDKYFKDVISNSSATNTISLGHCRHTTQGGNGYNQTHPFTIEGIDGDKVREMVGIHNGSLTGWSTRKGASSYKVDSEWALNHIFDNGIKAFEDFDGAYVFAWWDSDNSKVLNIALNDKRPIHVAFLTTGGMAFASEAGMLHWMLERNGMKYKENIRELTAGHWYKFEAGKHEEFIKLELPKYRTPVSSSVNNTYKTVLQRVQEIIDKANTPNPLVVVPGPSTPLTQNKTTTTFSGEEITAAKELSIYLTDCEFTPKHKDGDVLVGTANIWDVEWDAEIRGASNIAWSAASIFKVKVMGVVDKKDKNMVILVSKPRVAVKEPEPLT